MTAVERHIKTLPTAKTHIKTFKVKPGQNGDTNINLLITPFTDGTPWKFNKVKSSGKIGKTNWTGFVIEFKSGATANAVVTMGFNTSVLGESSGWTFLDASQVTPVGSGADAVYQPVDPNDFPDYADCWTRLAVGQGQGQELRLFVLPDSSRIVGAESVSGISVNNQASYGTFPDVILNNNTLSITFSPDAGDMFFNLNVIAYLQDQENSNEYAGYASQDPGFSTRCVSDV